MKLVIVLSVVAAALAAPEGYHYDPPAITSTLYFPQGPEAEDCTHEHPPPLPAVTVHKEVPTYSHHTTSHVYTAPVKKVELLQPLKTHVTLEPVQHAWGANQQQSTVWGNLKYSAQAPKADFWGSSGALQNQHVSVKTDVQPAWKPVQTHVVPKVEQAVWGSSGALNAEKIVYQAPPKIQQASVWTSANQHQSSSWGSSINKHSQQSSVWVQPQHQVEEVFKHVYVHVPPEDKEEYEAPHVIQPVVHKQKHYKIIFIKAPSPPSPKSVIVPPQPLNEEKTIVYVLHKKPEHHQEVIVQKPAPAKQNKPEVFFIKYKNKEEVKQHVKLVSTTAAPASWEPSESLKIVDDGASSYSSGSSGSSYSYVSSTAAPITYTTPAPAKYSASSSSGHSISTNHGTSGGYSYVSSTPAPVVYTSAAPVVKIVESAPAQSSHGSSSYSYVSSTAAPIAYTTGHSVKIVESEPSRYSATAGGIGTGFEYSSNFGSSGSLYNSYSSGSTGSSGYGSYLGVANPDCVDHSNTGLGVINVGVNDYSSTIAPVAKSTSYVSTTPHSIVSSTIGHVAVQNSGSSGYSQRSSGRSRSSTTKKPCRRCSSTTSAPLNIYENAYTSNLY